MKQAGKVTYQIDPLGRRSARLVNGLITNRYAYNPNGQLIAELDKAGNLKKTFIYASKSHVPDYFIDSNNNRFKIVTDQLGSLRLVINTATGEVKEKMNHDEFGKVLIDTNPNYIPFGFAGGIYDTETKLVRFGVRDYDSEIGRWTSKDPIRFDAKDTNIYGYVFSDPINKIDPSGKISQASAALCAVALAAGVGYDAYKTIQNGIALHNQYENQITALEKKKNSCTTSSSEIAQINMDISKLLNEYQLKSQQNTAGLWGAGKGATTGVAVCLAALANF